MASHVQRTLTNDLWIIQILTGIHVACWHFESYFIDIAYNYVRRTTRCFKKNKKNIAVVQGCITEASSSTIWRSADVRQTQENIALCRNDICKTLSLHFNSEIHCSHKWCYRQFTNISRMLKRKHSTGEQTQESTAHLGHQTGVPRKKKVDCYFHRKNAFFVKKAARSRGHPSIVCRSCWQSVLRKQLKNEPGKSVTSDIQT